MTGRDETPSRRVKLTYDGFVLFPDDGLRHELIDGEHYATPSPNIRHQRISRRLTVAIASWLTAHPIGEVFAAPLDVVFTRFDVVEPDLVYVSNERARECITEKHALGADLAIEILSPGTRRRDETLKRLLYERTGVVEYWLIEPDNELVKIYRRDGQGFGAPTQLALERGEVLSTPLLPGFEVPLSGVFHD